MRHGSSLSVVLFALLLLSADVACPDDHRALVSSPITSHREDKMSIKLPEPRYDGGVSFEKSLVERRSVRDFSGKPLSLEQVSQLLWASQGITSGWGGRTAPSAGALYPLEVYVVAGHVNGLAAGVYQYGPKEHEIVMVSKGDMRSKLGDAALAQTPVKEAAIDIVIAAVYQRTTRKYGDRGVRYVHMEAGHAGQNVCLQATAMGLGAVTIGAFYDKQVSGILGLPEEREPLYIIPVGTR